MATINLPHDFSPNTDIVSSEVDDNFTTIYNEFNGSISAANLAANAVSTAKIADSAVTTAKINDLGVTTAKINAGAVTNAKLDTTAGGPGGAWATWTPTWTNVTVGNATQASTYSQVGKIVYFKLYLVWGSTTSQAGSAIFSLPVTSVALVGTGEPMGQFRSTGPTKTWHGPVIPNNTTTAILRWFQVSSTGVTEANLSSTSPETWTTGNAWWAQGFYEAA